MLHQVNIFLLLFGALQGWILSLWFFANRRKELSSLYMGVVLFLVGLQLTSKVITKMWLMDNAQIFYSLSYKLPYLVAPMLFLYAQAHKSKTFQPKDLLHLLPFCISAFFSIDVLNLRLYPHPYTDACFQMILLVYYSYRSIKISERSLRTFIITFAVAEAVIIATLAVMVMYYGRFPDVRILFVVLTALIYWISYKIVSGTTPFKYEHEPISLTVQRVPKYAHSSLKTEEAQRIQSALIELMDIDKVYLDTGITIDSVAAKIGTSRHNLSQVLNESIGKPFHEFVNGYRLEESRRRLSDPKNARYTIAAIASDSGFSSVSSFNDIFKKRYNTTPSRFREENLKRMSA